MTNPAGQSDVDRVREATDLVALIGEHVALRPRGREHVGLCPFHDDHSPSLAVVTHKGNAFYKCHACGAAGDAFAFVMTYHRQDFGEALRYLADRAGITLRARVDSPRRSEGPGRTEIRQANAFAASFFRRRLRDPVAGQVARSILEQRGISPEMTEQFALGVAPEGFTTLVEALKGQAGGLRAAAEAGLLRQRDDGSYYDAFRHRLIFPICDELGNPIAFGGRRIDPEDQPKYLNSAESVVFHKSRTLYGLHLAKRAIIESRQAVVTEGYTDVIACHQAGFTNTIGTLGTALTREHARPLSRLCDTVVLVFDGDEAGQRAADRGVEVFFHEPVEVRICVLPDNLDPDDLLRQPEGGERFRAAIEDAEDALVYKVGRFRAQLGGATTPAAQEKLLSAFLTELADLGFGRLQGVRKRWVLSRLAECLGLSVDDVARAMPRPRGPRPAAASPEPSEAAGATQTQVTLGAEAGGPLVRTVSRARRLAEREMLAILIYDPTVGSQSIDPGEGETGPVAEIFAESDFAEPASAAISRFVLARLAAGETYTVQQLLEGLAEPEHRQVASSLYFEGERRCEAGAQPALNDAALALYKCLRSEQYRRQVSARKLDQLSPEQKLDALHELLEKRRQQGDMAGAIVQGMRS